MPDATQELTRPSTTYCPFKEPARASVPMGGGVAATRKFEQRPGMALVHASLPESVADAPDRWLATSHLQLVFVFQGRLELAFADQRSIRTGSGDWVVVKPGLEPIQLVAREPSSLFWIEFDFQATQSLTGFSDTVTPRLLDAESSILERSPATGRLLDLARELSQLFGENTRERLLIESKTLEWLALLLDQPVFSPCRAIARSRIEREEHALAAAARILESSCHEEHSLAQLSRSVHLNEFKLKRGFKERFGTTVFGFLRQKRMELARELLASESQSVIEVANRVGYSNPSHFARAFREAFGINPSSFLRNEPGTNNAAV